MHASQNDELPEPHSTATSLFDASLSTIAMASCLHQGWQGVPTTWKLSLGWRQLRRSRGQSGLLFAHVRSACSRRAAPTASSKRRSSSAHFGSIAFGAEVFRDVAEPSDGATAMGARR